MFLTTRRVTWAGLLAVLLLTVSTPSQACEWLWPWNWCRRPAAVNYAPMAIAPVCAPVCEPTCAPACAPTTTYMPVTAYSVLRPVTVTTLSPVRSGCCLFGGPTTTYRPVTSIVYRPQVVPYASFRPVLSAPCSTCSVATTTYRIGNDYSLLSSSASPSCATGCGAPVVTQMPAAPAPTAVPAPLTAPAPAATPMLPQPTTPSAAPATPPPTYEQPRPAGSPEQQQPGNGTSTGINPMRLPQLTQQPLVRQAVYHKPVSQGTSSELDASGWHAAR